MATPFAAEESALVWRSGPQTLRIEPWGRDGLRVRATVNQGWRELPGALRPKPDGVIKPDITLGPESAAVRCGLTMAEITAEGRLTFRNTASGALLLREPAPRFIEPPARWFRPAGGDAHWIAASFEPNEGERFYGLGQHQHGLLDQKGCIIDLWHRNTEVSIPFLVSNRGYGFLWHNPAVGRVELGRNGTRWIAEATDHIDYWITGGYLRGDHGALRGRHRPRACPARVGRGFLAMQTALRQTQDEAAGRRPRVQAPRPAARRHRGRLLPLDAHGRMALRPHLPGPTRRQWSPSSSRWASA